MVGGEAGAEAVVDVHDGHAAAATVEHAQQRRHASKTRPVAHARRHGDHRPTHQTGDHAGQRALHPGDGDDDICLAHGGHAREQPVQPGHADIVHAHDLVAHEICRESRLVGDRQITRPGAQHGDGAGALGQALGLDGDAPRGFVVHGAGELPAHGGGVVGVGAGDQHALLALHHLGRNGGDLARGLAGTENNLGETLPQRPMRIDLRKAKVVDRRGAQHAQHLGLIDLAGLVALQQLAGFLWCHLRGINTGHAAASRRKRAWPGGIDLDHLGAGD